MSDDTNVLICPHCGLVFFADVDRVMSVCPVCERRFKIRTEALLEAQLQAEPHEKEN